MNDKMLMRRERYDKIRICTVRLSENKRSAALVAGNACMYDYILLSKKFH